jgi:hypothetical protein
MSIINRRNAVLGWAVWTTAKKTASIKAKRSMSSSESSGPSKPLVAATFAGLAGAVGALAFWRRHNSGDATA